MYIHVSHYLQYLSHKTELGNNPRISRYIDMIELQRQNKLRK